MRIHASAEHGTCVELLAEEQSRTGWTAGGQTDDQPRGGADPDRTVETHEVGV